MSAIQANVYSLPIQLPAGCPALKSRLPTGTMPNSPANAMKSFDSPGCEQTRRLGKQLPAVETVLEDGGCGDGPERGVLERGFQEVSDVVN